jgi:hypothetical protein
MIIRVQHHRRRFNILVGKALLVKKGEGFRKTVDPVQ